MICFCFFFLIFLLILCSINCISSNRSKLGIPSCEGIRLPIGIRPGRRSFGVTRRCAIFNLCYQQRCTVIVLPGDGIIYIVRPDSGHVIVQFNLALAIPVNILVPYGDRIAIVQLIAVVLKFVIAALAGLYNIQIFQVRLGKIEWEFLLNRRQTVCCDDNEVSGFAIIQRLQRILRLDRLVVFTLKTGFMILTLQNLEGVRYLCAVLIIDQHIAKLNAGCIGNRIVVENMILTVPCLLPFATANAVSGDGFRRLILYISIPRGGLIIKHHTDSVIGIFTPDEIFDRVRAIIGGCR